MKLLSLSSAVYDELNNPTGISIPFINSWFVNNVGQLNINLDTSIVISGNYEPEPELNLDQANIFKTMFYEYYYSRQVNANLGANGYTPIEIREADTVVRVISKSEYAKQYMVMQKNAQEQLKDSISLYRYNRSVPLAAQTSGSWSEPTTYY